MTSYQDLRAQEARLVKTLDSEKQRQTILERMASILDTALEQDRQRLNSLRTHLDYVQKSLVVNMQSFKEAWDAIGVAEVLYSKHLKEAEEVNVQIAENLTKLTSLDAEITSNLIEQSEFGQLIDIDDYR